jgi:hypothetical protein
MGRKYKKFTVNIYTYQTVSELDNTLQSLKDKGKIRDYYLREDYIIVE